jgi:hypothetical protein
MPDQCTILGGKVYLYERPAAACGSAPPILPANTSISTKEPSLSITKEIAED